MKMLPKATPATAKNNANDSSECSNRNKRFHQSLLSRIGKWPKMDDYRKHGAHKSKDDVAEEE
jgi:hypothetical protein